MTPPPSTVLAREAARHKRRTGHPPQGYLVPVLDAAGNPTGLYTQVRTCC